MFKTVIVALVVLTVHQNTAAANEIHELHRRSKDVNCDVPADVVILIDGSDSVLAEEWKKTINFVTDLIDQLDISPDGNHVGEIVFSSSIGDVIKLKPYKNKAELKRQTKQLGHPQEGTHTAKGIERTRQMIREEGRVDAPNIVLVITDGKSKRRNETIEQARLAKQEDITMVAVGVGGKVNDDELLQIASKPEFYHSVETFDALSGLIFTLKDMICQDIDKCAAQPCQNGGTCTSRGDGYTCSCLTGYSGFNCETGTDYCSPNPCQNGGNCGSTTNGYICSCRDGFSGNRCQTRTNYCSPNPCQNGGNCGSTQNGYICSCRGGFSGNRCQTRYRPTQGTYIGCYIDNQSRAMNGFQQLNNGGNSQCSGSGGHDRGASGHHGGGGHHGGRHYGGGHRGGGHHGGGHHGGGHGGWGHRGKRHIGWFTGGSGHHRGGHSGGSGHHHGGHGSGGHTKTTSSCKSCCALAKVTTDACVRKCRSLNFQFAGTQYGNQCFCGNSYDRYGKANEGGCSYKCAGNGSQKCGGYWRNSVYYTGL